MISLLAPPRVAVVSATSVPRYLRHFFHCLPKVQRHHFSPSRHQNHRHWRPFSTKISSSSSQSSVAAVADANNTMLVLGERHVRQALDEQQCLDITRQALISLRDKRGVVPSRLMLTYPNNPNITSKKNDRSADDDCDVDDAPQDCTLVKPAAYYSVKDEAEKNGPGEDDVTMGLKVISLRAKNPSKGLPLAPATIMLWDGPSGIVKATLAGTHLTVMRTSAGPALAVQHLKRNCEELVVFGAGAQAKCHIELIEHVLKTRNHPLQKITIINRTLNNANALKDKILGQKHKGQETAGTSITSAAVINTVALDDVDGISKALSTADVVCTTTNTTTPLWDSTKITKLKKGCLITSIGSYTPDMQEIPSEIVDKCHVIIDTPEALAVGDLKHLNDASRDDVNFAGDVFADPQSFLDTVTAEATGVKNNDQSQPKDYIFYKAVGTAIQDVLTAKAVVDNARRLGLGHEVDMS